METEGLVLEIIRCLENERAIQSNGNECTTTCNLYRVLSHAECNRYKDFKTVLQKKKKKETIWGKNPVTACLKKC